ncbi:zinc finger MYM-type protein 1-like [Impatiens glandulifera]|uniref:zinc finger MYM-type protein 1-like n=1 Tax=Impatiens glandulifera TaxID=253017 RepID=UPI001FB0FF51|nr:zinc finger MYM-type protein 1-like [Impatiens glandulifera]
MTIVIRCVDIDDIIVKVHEFFLGFINVEDTSGLGLFKRLEDVLIELHLNIDDIRGQGYDNGSNMKGKHQGVQKRLLDVNPRAFYIPCGCHSLNLVICDIAKSCDQAKDFFGYLQKIYTLFSGSTQRWDLLKTFVKNLTPKPLSTTRWESRIESVRAIKNQVVEFRDALVELSITEKHDQIGRIEAKGLWRSTLEDFEFLISLCIWYKLLDKVNRVSKLLQQEDMEIDDAITRLKELIIYFENVRECGFEDLMEEARTLAHKVGIDPVFVQKRVSRRPKKFDEGVNDYADGNQSLEDKFRITYFLRIIDQTLTSLRDWFEQLERFEELFGFLFNGKFKSVSEEQLRQDCTKLENFLKHNQQMDIDGDALFKELINLKTILPAEVKRSIDILNFTRSFWEAGCFQNVGIVYRILLTIPVTVASVERSFSKLKLIKTYLRSTMSQERLNGLAMISIEKECLEQLEYDDLIENFASKNARRSMFS